jgi:hypothetical protein
MFSRLVQSIASVCNGFRHAPVTGLDGAGFALYIPNGM